MIQPLTGLPGDSIRNRYEPAEVEKTILATERKTTDIQYPLLYRNVYSD